MTRTIVTATWVPPGARVRDGKRRRLYAGDTVGNAWRAFDGMAKWARWSTCGGVVLLEMHGGETAIKTVQVDTPLTNGDAPRQRGHVPCPVCARPLHPLSGDSLGCVECGRRVDFLWADERPYRADDLRPGHLRNVAFDDVAQALTAGAQQLKPAAFSPAHMKDAIIDLARAAAARADARRQGLDD